MAERRMFSSKVVCSDAFANMPFSAQSLYVQLCMEADDDGFLNRAKRIQGSIGASDADLDLLFENRFILGFKNGVIAIKHWRMNNQIRKDRYTPTQYQDEFNSLVIRPDGAYTEKVKDKEAVDNLATTWQPNDNQHGNQAATQNSIGKDSIDKLSIGEERTVKESPDCQQIVDLFNSICISLPSVRSLSNARKKAIKARLNTYTVEDFKQCFENAEASAFLKGGNARNWTATFDWLIMDSNMAKVLDGNYSDKPKDKSKSFDTDEFFEAAIARAQDEMKAKTKTAAEDEDLRKRASDLAAELKEKYK